VLRGQADTALLDSYGLERSAHVQHAIGMSVELGKVICMTDPDQAAQRDAFMIGQGADPARILPPLPPPTLTDGIVHRSASGDPAPGAGVLTPQARVTYRGRTGLLDEVVDAGFVLACTQDPTTVLDADQRAFLDAVGVTVLHLVPPLQGDGDREPEGAAADVDGVYLPHLHEAGDVAALIRPDHYLFGTASSLDQLPALVADLKRQLGPTSDRAADTAADSATGDVAAPQPTTTPV
jgi:hypothetical protein